MYLPYISQYFLGKYTVSTRKYCTVKGSVTKTFLYKIYIYFQLGLKRFLELLELLDYKNSSRQKLCLEASLNSYDAHYTRIYTIARDTF
jgi:hypothetical protein